MNCVYYVDEIKQYDDNIKSKQLYAKQQKLFSNVRQQNIRVKR